jgi:hypothetical protein
MASLFQGAKACHEEARNAPSPSAAGGARSAGPSPGRCSGTDTDRDSSSLGDLLSSAYTKIAHIQNMSFTIAERIVLSKLEDRDRAIAIGMKDPLAAVLAQALTQQGIPLPPPVPEKACASVTPGVEN